jgi:hypothetical protein
LGWRWLAFGLGAIWVFCYVFGVMLCNYVMGEKQNVTKERNNKNGVTTRVTEEKMM